MPLTSLILDGFKSFADKTEIQFTNGITGIVGPNGSGKSNITEAIRWVMGEGSAKSLRGRSMKDVIFAGSEFRKPLNRAEVTMVFDNRQRELDLPADRVTIARRILQSGDNEYLINGKQVRLRDVRALFMDSGLSQNSLAIISQGRVDQILNSQPKERRGIIEEAAGVLHFKQQKQQAQAQLETTNDNLIRINDLVKELEKRIEPLHEQSSLAMEYKFQKQGLDRDLKTLLAFEIENFNQEREETMAKATQSKQILDKLDAEVKQSQAKLAAKREEFQMESQRRDGLQQEVLEVTKRLSEISTHLQMAQQSRQYDQATKSEYERQVQELESDLGQVAKDLERLQANEEEWQEKVDALKEKRRKLASQLRENPDQLNQELDALRSSYIQTLQDQTSANNQVVYLKGELKRAKESQDLRAADVSDQLAKSRAELEKLREQGKKLGQARTEKEDQARAAADELGQLALQKQEVDQKLAINSRNLQKTTARRDALSNIQKRHEGYYAGVRAILNQLDQYPGIIGAVGELLTFSSDLEAAMTTALGSGVQDLVATSKLAARDAIQRLKQKRAGRATFLPLDGLRVHAIPASTRKSLAEVPGFQGVASDLVDYQGEQDLTAAIEYLLGNIIIVDTMDTALKVSRTIGRYRVVTLDGDVISPGGAMTGGMRNQRSNSPLQITAEISKLTEEIQVLTKQVDRYQEQAGQLEQKINKLDQAAQQAKNDLQELNQELNSAVLTFKSQEKEVSRLESASRLYQRQLAEKEQRIADLTAQLVKEKDQQTKLASQAEIQKTQLADLQEKIQNYAEMNADVQKQLADLDPELAVLQNKLENLQGQVKERQKHQKSSQEQLGRLQEKLASLSSASAVSESKKQELKLERQQLEEKRSKRQQSLDQASQLLGQLNAQINQLETVATRNYDLRKDAASEQEEYSVKLATIKSQISHRLDTLREDYGLTYEAARAQAQVKNTPENLAALSKSVKLHQMSLDDIGPVNLGAIDEYKEVKERYDFLNGQQDDLLKARENLQQSMDELDGEVKDRFAKTFNEIAASFAKLFPLVFGGGHAKLQLTDPDDLLESGVEIIAQPPGKKLQRLSLLSGGERSLTAITLLFAMLEVNPVPFCVLDEVEAALDDANVLRFARFLRQYDLHTQFIVITHRRGTMEKADQLYGVVMQESGVSQVLSVSLKDLKDDEV